MLRDKPSSDDEAVVDDVVVNNVVDEDAAATPSASSPSPPALWNKKSARRQGLTLVHFWLNVSAFSGTGGASRACLAV